MTRDETERQGAHLSEGARYAYGFTDKKPGKAWWAVQIIMTLAAIAHLFGLWGR